MAASIRIHIVRSLNIQEFFSKATVENHCKIFCTHPCLFSRRKANPQSLKKWNLSLTLFLCLNLTYMCLKIKSFVIYQLNLFANLMIWCPAFFFIKIGELNFTYKSSWRSWSCTLLTLLILFCLPTTVHFGHLLLLANLNWCCFKCGREDHSCMP